jgi:hypothetical protein
MGGEIGADASELLVRDRDEKGYKVTGDELEITRKNKKKC